MKYTVFEPTNKQLNEVLTMACTNALCGILPLDVLHCMVAGVQLHWILTVSARIIVSYHHPTVVIQDEKRGKVLVWEKRDDGEKVTMFAFSSSRMKDRYRGTKRPEELPPPKPENLPTNDDWLI